MTKDEFGANLFECIKTISGLHTLRQQLNVAVHHEDKRAQVQLAARYHEAQEWLVPQLKALTEDEWKQVQARYPDVVTL
jgi:hypothetical protein